MSSPTGIIPCLSSSPVPDKQGKTNKLHPRNIPIVDGEIPMLDVLIPIFMMKSLLLMLNPKVSHSLMVSSAEHSRAPANQVPSTPRWRPPHGSIPELRSVTWHLYIYIYCFISYMYSIWLCIIYIIYIQIQCGCIIYVNLHDVSCIIHV